MDKASFSEFEPVSEKAWKQKIQTDLKGKDYNKTMLTSTDEGIDIKPFYHRDSLQDFKIPSPDKWFITKKSNVLNSEDFQKNLSKGIEAFWFSIDNSKKISQDIISSDVPLIFNLKDFRIEDLSVKENIFYDFDPIHHLAETGNWLINQSEDLKKHKSYVNKTNNLSINAGLYHNAGGNITQQLAYTLSHLNTYLKNLEKPKTNLNITIFTSIGPNYFFEIAKLKAFRLLVNTLCKNYNIHYKLKLVSQPGLHHMSIYDYNVNMLRATTECMSAVLGGSNFVSNLAYDEIFKNKNDFSQRIARNQLLILKHESYFDKVKNPTDGVYYINQITKSLGEKSLNIFKSIEKSGGFIQQLFDGKIQEKINQQFNKSLENFDNKSIKLVGVNIFMNEEEQIKTQLDKDIFLKPKSRKTLIKPIIPKRIAESLEKKRLKNESPNQDI